MMRFNLFLALSAALAAGDDGQVRQLRGRKNSSSEEAWTFLNPNPDVLVWDEETEILKGGHECYSGWLKTPLVHDLAMSPYEAVPYVCLRVRAVPATQQPAKNGPLLFHCGGPGSGKECLPKNGFDIHGEGNASQLNSHFDWWAIDQRGVGLEGMSSKGQVSNSTPPCPFKYESGEPIHPFPAFKCSELMKSDITFKEMIQLMLGSDVSESELEEAKKYVYPILYVRGLSATNLGIMGFDEAYVRWFYRIVKLEHSLCYTAPRYKLKSPSGREYNVLQFGGTIDLVQDIDQFRQAIGASKMSIYGMSYGTSVAGAYGTIFAEHTNRLVMDGVVDPFPDVEQRGHLFAKGITATWNGITSACDLSILEEPDDQCSAAPLSETKALRLIEDTSNPVRAAFIMSLVQLAIFKYAEPMAAVALACIEKYSTGKDLDGCPDWLLEVGLVPVVPEEVASNLTSSDDSNSSNSTDSNSTRRVPKDWFRLSEQALVMGTDTAGRLNEEAVVRWWKESKATQPLGTPWALAWVVALSTWPANARPLPPLGSTTISPLIVGNLHDPNTAYTSAQLARSAFPQGHLVTWQGYGHCMPILGPVAESLSDKYQEAQEDNLTMNYTFSLAKYACVSRIQNYVETGNLPLDGHTCLVPRLLDTGRTSLARGLAFMKKLWNISQQASMDDASLEEQ